MFWIFRQIQKLITALNSNSRIPEIALGLTLGISLGLLPFNIILSGLLILAVIIIRCNVAAVFLGLLIGNISGTAVDPIAKKLGYIVLTLKPLTPFWTTLYNLPIVPLSRFNHSHIGGMLILLIIGFYPIYKLMSYLVAYYRTHLQERIKKSKIYKTLKLSSVVNITQKLK